MIAALSTKRSRMVVWSFWVVAALCMLPLFGGAMFAVVIAVSAVLLAAVPGALPRGTPMRDSRDLLAIAAMYVAVVGLMRLALVVFTTANTLGLFLAFAA